MELQKREENKDEKQIGKPNGKRKKGKRYLHKKKKKHLHRKSKESILWANNSRVNCAEKEIAEKDSLVTSRNGDKKHAILYSLLWHRMTKPFLKPKLKTSLLSFPGPKFGPFAYFLANPIFT